MERVAEAQKWLEVPACFKMAWCGVGRSLSLLISGEMEPNLNWYFLLLLQNQLPSISSHYTCLFLFLWSHCIFLFLGNSAWVIRHCTWLYRLCIADFQVVPFILYEMIWHVISQYYFHIITTGFPLTNIRRFIKCQVF